MGKEAGKGKYESNRKLEVLGDIVSEYLGSMSWSQDVLDANAVLIYNSYPFREEFSRAKYVIGGILFVTVESPACATEISLRQSEIVSYINGKLGRTRIKKLRFHVGILDKDKDKR